MKVDGERVTLGELCRAVFAMVRDMPRWRQERQVLTALGAQHARAELSHHLSSWVSRAVRRQTGSPDMTMAVGEDLADIVDRLTVACALLDDEMGREVAHARDRAAHAHVRLSAGESRQGLRALVSAVQHMRQARVWFDEDEAVAR